MKKVAIVGAGISGLYLANELNKNTEIDYKIFEKKWVFCSESIRCWSLSRDTKTG